jgi:hypothetical protein
VRYRGVVFSWYRRAAFGAWAVSFGDIRRSLTERFQWLGYPLVIFMTSRLLLLAFSRAAPLFGAPVGPHPAPTWPWAAAHPVWAALAHGELPIYARIATTGYAMVADASRFPLLAWLAKGLLALGGSAESWLLVLSFLACAAGFVGVYRVFERLRGADAACWGLALLAAFPFAYHLSDGGALAALLAFSAWGVWLGLRGRWLTGAVLLALGGLAHPACLAALILVALPGAKLWRRAVFVLLPLLVLAGWLVHLRSHFGPALWPALWPSSPSLMSPWLAMAVVFGGGLAVGILMMVLERDVRVLALGAAAQLVMVLWVWTPGAVHGLAACWPAFLVGGDFLVRRNGLRIPALAMLATHQGLLLFCFVHYLPLA